MSNSVKPTAIDYAPANADEVINRLLNELRQTYAMLDEAKDIIGGTDLHLLSFIGAIQQLKRERDEALVRIHKLEHELEFYIKGDIDR